MTRKQQTEFSKLIVRDIRPLLWMVTLGGFFLALVALLLDRNNTLPWITALVGLPWTAHGTVCSFYMSLAKSDHSAGGITFEAAKAKNFDVDKDL